MNPLTRRLVMSRIRKKNTKPELAVRAVLTQMGYRYRLHRNDLPGCPDVAFIGLRKVIFCHGCFWHQHGCSNTRTPKANLGYWTPKLARNIERDNEARQALAKLGWKTLIVWECEIHHRALPVRLRRFLGGNQVMKTKVSRNKHP